MSGPIASPPAPTRNRGRRISTALPNPDRYIRRVKGGKYQARPHDENTGERDNLGLFATREQAQKAIREYWWGQRSPKPKFVRRAETKKGSRFFVLIPSALPGGKKWLRVGEWYDTEEEAAAAAREVLERTYGRIVAAAMLSRKDTSRKARRMT